MIWEIPCVCSREALATSLTTWSICFALGSSVTGDSGAASATGKHGCAAAFGWGCQAMAAETGAIFLVRRRNDGEITHVFASRVGDNGIKAGVWYVLGDDGQPVEAA